MNGTPTQAATLRLGTRGSTLARRQAAIAVSAIRAVHPTITCDVLVIRTRGDLMPEQPVSEFEDQGAFVRQIENALLAERIDLAVHSFKDMPSASTPGLRIGAFLPRADPSDVLVSRSGRRLAELPAGATVGTGSPRRAALLRSIRPEANVVALRGNVDTRLRRVADGDLDAVVLALAGLQRLGREHEVTEILEPLEFTPAVGQGILAVQIRADDQRLADLLTPLDDAATRVCASAERAVALTIAASCHTPLGAYARISNAQLELSAVLASDEPISLLRVRDRGDPFEAVAIGERAGLALIAALREAMSI